MVKKYIYGFDYYAKWTLVFLLNQEIYVAGFIVEDHSTKIGHKFSNKTVIGINDLGDEDYTIIDLFGKNLHKIRKFTTREIISPFANNKPHFIYGAGLKGKKAWENFQLMDIDVKGFIDRDKDKWGKEYCGKQIISLDMLKEIYSEATVFISLDMKIAESVKEELTKSLPASYNVYILPPRKSLCQFHDGADMELRELYQIEHFILGKKKLILFGELSDIILLYRRLALLDIPVEYGVDILSDYTGEKGNVTFCDKQELLYEDMHDVVVLVLNSCQNKALEFCQNYMMDTKLFWQFHPFNITRLDYSYVIDPNLGYSFVNSDYNSLINLTTDSAKNYPLHIAIIGGSTSDILLFNHTSWPEVLVEILNKHQVSATVHCGGKAGYTSSQELITFIRDLSHEKIDILISYSGVNENDLLEPIKENYFIQLNQYNLNKHRGKLNFGHGMDSHAKHWIHQERMIHGICQELGIKFFAIFQTSLRLKENCSAYDKFIWDFEEYYFKNDMADIKENCEHRELQVAVRQNLSQYSWLYDLSTVFDGYNEDIFFDIAHLTEEGNRILAKKIWDVIKKDVLTLAEERR